MTPELRKQIEELAQLNYHEAGFQRTAYLRGAKDMFKLMIDECRLRKLDEALIAKNKAEACIQKAEALRDEAIAKYDQAVLSKDEITDKLIEAKARIQALEAREKRLRKAAHNLIETYYRRYGGEPDREFFGGTYWELNKVLAETEKEA